MTLANPYPRRASSSRTINEGEGTSLRFAHLRQLTHDAEVNLRVHLCFYPSRIGGLFPLIQGAILPYSRVSPYSRTEAGALS